MDEWSQVERLNGTGMGRGICDGRSLETVPGLPPESPFGTAFGRIRRTDLRCVEKTENRNDGKRQWQAVAGGDRLHGLACMEGNLNVGKGDRNRWVKKCLNRCQKNPELSVCPMRSGKGGAVLRRRPRGFYGRDSSEESVHDRIAASGMHTETDMTVDATIVEAGTTSISTPPGGFVRWTGPRRDISATTVFHSSTDR